MYYTKYRPRNFSEIQKPNNVADALMNQLKKGKVVHAYLFIGPRGTGKTTTARILAKALNVTKLNDDGDFDPQDPVAQAIHNGTFLDLIEIDAASNRGIDDIRQLREKIKLSPSEGRQKVYIIDEVHMLTNEAFNALLKTLEEPPKHATLILCTTEEQKIPETIKSRCQIFKFKRANIPQLVEKLGKIAKEEGAKLKNTELEKIARASFGGYRDAETLLQQVIEGEVDLESFVGSNVIENYFDFVNFLSKNETKEALNVISNVLEDGGDVIVWVTNLLYYLRDLLYISSGCSPQTLDIPEKLLSDIQKQADAVGTELITHYIEVFNEAHSIAKSTFLPQLPVEVAIVKLNNGFDSSKIMKNVPNLPVVDPDEPNFDLDLDLMKKNVPKKLKNELSDSGTQVEDSERSSSLPTSGSVIPFEEILKSWKKVIEVSTPKNHSIKSLLKAGKPTGVAENKIEFTVPFKFHKERIESSKNRGIIESVLEEVFGIPLALKCVVDEASRPKNKSTDQDLTDHNVAIPSSTESGDMLNFFDGGLPSV